MAGEEARDSSAAGSTDQPEPDTKRLRSTDHDLKIIVKDSSSNNSDSSEESSPIEKEYYFYAQVLSNLSKFIDASLSVEMKEKETREIVFHDVSPEVFELAIKFQQDLVAVHSMTAQDVVKVAEFYDKYEFAGGLDLCDTVLCNYFTKNKSKELPDDNLDLMVDAIVLADKLMLEKARKAGIDFLETRLNEFSVPYGRTMFTEDHFKKIVPLLKSKAVRFDEASDMTEEEFDSPLFPKYMVSKLSSREMSSSLRNLVPVIRVSGTTYKVDGNYSLDVYFPRYYCNDDRHFRWKGEEITVTVERHHDTMDWAIIGRKYNPQAGEDDENDEEEEDGGFEWVLWKCPHSRNLQLPPREPWIPVDEVAIELTAEGTSSRKPRIDYLPY